MKKNRIVEKYGRWAAVMGASEGIGFAFAEELAAAGLSLILAARREAPLLKAAEYLKVQYKIDTEILILDLSLPNPWRNIETVIGEKDLGLIIYNAAASPIGPFLDMDLNAAQRTVAVNVASPLNVVHGAGNLFRKRWMETGRRGGIILLSSLSGLGGTPYVAAYAASKAWNIIFAEGTGAEARKEGVDIMACIAGATDTPGYRDSVVKQGPGAPVQSSRAVAKSAVRALGRKTSVIPGFLNKIVAVLIYGRIRRLWATAVLGRSTAVLRHRDDVRL